MAEDEQEPGDAVRYGRFWRRFWAYMLDGLIVFVLALPLALLLLLALLAATGAGDSALDDVEPLFDVLTSLGGFLTQWAYWAGLESSERRATWGKRALGLAVVDRNGDRLGFGRASGRFLAKMLTFLTVIGCLLPVFRRDRRALHDLLASTFVIDVRANDGT